MDHRFTSIQFLRSTGLIPVKVRPNQKDPFGDWDPRTVGKQDHAATLRQLETNPELNLGALFFGRYVDIDDDSNALYLKPALDLFLPKTPYVWGRATKPRSHRAFALQHDFDRDVYGPLLRFMKALKIGDDSYSIEVRGGKAENGLFTVLPGSYREDVDEMVEWTDNVDTSVSVVHLPIWYMMKQLRLAQATALLANYFGDGVRNDMSLAIAGLLWRIRASSLIALGADHESEIPEDVFLLSEDDADAVFKNLLKLADPNDADRRQRELNYNNTWNKLNNDPAAKITGGKVLADLIGVDGEKVVRALYRLLSDNDGIEALEKLAEQFVVWYGQGVLLDLSMVQRGSDKPWMTREQAANSLGATKILIANKKVPVVNLLFGSSAIRRVGGMTFDPSTNELLVSKDGETLVNQWRGWSVEPSPQRVSDEEMEPFTNYILNILSSGNQEVCDWITSWVADVFQDPSHKPGTTLVLVGVQGAGKTFLGERVIGKIIGPHHYTQMNSIDQLTSKFNSIADNKVFIQCDEAIHSYQKDISSRLKSLITDESITIEPKGINSYRKPNHIHFLFTSNETNNPIFIDSSPHERRITVVHISPDRARDLEYWSYMRSWTEMNLHKILRWLMDYKYEKKTINRPLTTAAKRKIQRLGVDPEVSWIVNRIAMGFPIGQKSHEHWWHAFNTEDITDADKLHDTIRRDAWPNRIYMPALEADFRDFVRQHGRSVYSGSIITILRGVFPEGSVEHGSQITANYTDPRTSQTVKNRVRTHNFPSQALILAHLNDRYGEVIEQLLIDAQDNTLAEESAPTPTEEEY